MKKYIGGLAFTLIGKRYLINMDLGQPAIKIILNCSIGILLV